MTATDADRRGTAVELSREHGADTPPLIPERDHRSVLADAIGPEAEALVYFFASSDRDAFYPQISLPDTTLSDLGFRNRLTGWRVSPAPST